MRLAIISPFLPEISGVGQYGVRLAQGLARTGRFTSVQVLANSGPGNVGHEHSEYREGVTVHRSWQRDRLNVAPALLKTLMRLQPDVVWFNLGLSIYGKSPVVNFFGHTTPMLVRAWGWPTVATVHELFEMSDLDRIGAAGHRLMRWGGSLAMRMILQADSVCFTLRSYAQLVAQKYDAPHVLHMPHGTFDAPRFTPLSAEKRILYFGGHAPFKGLDSLLEMYAELKAQDPELCLTVAGSDHPRFPGYFASMRSAYAQLPDVCWQENVPEAQLAGLFAAARVVALPYAATTGASSACIRAATHGRPVVAYDLRDLRALTSDEALDVAFVPIGDTTAFKTHLRYLLDHPADCERIGRANAQALQAHTLEATCLHYANLFYHVAERRASQPRGLRRYKYSIT